MADGASKRKRVTSCPYALVGQPPKRIFDSPSGRQGFETLTTTPGGFNRVWHEDSAGAGTADPEAEKKRLEFNSQRDRNARKAARKKATQLSAAPVPKAKLPAAPVSKAVARKSKRADACRLARLNFTDKEREQEALRMRNFRAVYPRGVSNQRLGCCGRLLIILTPPFLHRVATSF